MQLPPVGVVAGVVVAGLVALAGGPAHGQAYERRDVAVRHLAMSAGDVLTVALHPSTTPIELTARGLELEACPGTWDGEAAVPGAGSSWPARDGFVACIPFTDGRVALPSAASGGGSMHLVVAVRALSDSERAGSLTISFEPVDGFFMVTPPEVAAGARSPTVALDAPGRTIATGPHEGEDPVVVPVEELELVVRQRGRVVPGPRAGDQSSVWPSYGPVTPGERVSIRARNTGEEPVRFAIGVDVR